MTGTSGDRYFLKALGPPPTEAGHSSSLAAPVRDAGRDKADAAIGLPESWRGSAVVVLLSLLVLQAARWSIYLQPQYYFIKPAAVLGCWGLFLLAWKWRLRRIQRAERAGLKVGRWDVAHWIAGLAGGAVLAAGPLVEWLNRRFQAGDPPEFLAFDAVLATAMLLTVARSRQLRQAGLISSAFAALMVTFAKPDPAVYALAVLFGVVGLWRMMTTYWEGIESKAVGSTSRHVPFRFSILGLTTILVLLLAVAATALSRETWGWTSRWSFFSGGDQWSDPYATSGVGDGENLVAATKSAQSEGPVDSDLFIESKQRSLYDVITELYGDQKPTLQKESSQAVGVRTENYVHHHGRLAKVEQNTKSFQTSRTIAGQPRPKPEDVLSEALLLVTGSAPTHLAIETFDLFDGETWFQAEGNSRRTMVGLMPGDDNEWFCFKRVDHRGVFQGLKTYQVAFLHLKSERIPLPPLTEAWSIGHIKQPRFYRPTPDDGLQMTLGNTIPEFTVVRLVSRGFRSRGLPLEDFWREVRLSRPTRFDEAGDPLPPEEPELELPAEDASVAVLKQIAAEWTRDVGPGWAKVAAIVTGLREQYRCEPVDEPSLANFLQQRRGPDYLFATAAVLMLRTQGVPARLVSGFYLDPENYDRRTGKTAVLGQDAHFWAEVHVGDGNWLPIEPTPGYLPTPESLTLGDQLVQAALFGLAWVLDHWPAFALGAGALLMGLLLQRRLRDQLAWCGWRIVVSSHPPSAVRATLWYLERRAAQSGVRRRPHQPVGEWLSLAFENDAPAESNAFGEGTAVSLPKSVPLESAPRESAPRESAAMAAPDVMTRFQNLLQQQCYGNCPLSPAQVADAPRLCRRLVQLLAKVRLRNDLC